MRLKSAQNVSTVAPPSKNEKWFSGEIGVSIELHLGAK